MAIFFRELRSLATEALDTYTGLSESIMLTAVGLCRALRKATISPQVFLRLLLKSFPMS